MNTRRFVLCSLLVAGALCLAGCGNEDAQRTPTQTAQAFVDAVNVQDWPRLCELTKRFHLTPEECESTAAETFGPVNGKMRLEGVSSSPDKASFSVNVPADFRPTIEREGGVYKVHYEVTITR